MTKTTKSIARRLLPMYIAVFLQGFVLWYAIEKLFMVNIGFDDASIGLMVAAYSGLMLLIETPSGILADRWSRKGVLILASIFLAISSVLCGLSDSIPLYIFGILFWGVFYALYSGTYDSILYDTLLEETGDSKGYEKYLGRMHAVDSAALVLGGLLGGLVSEWFGLRASFYWTVPIALASIVALWLFREPHLHKNEVPTPFKEHAMGTFKAIFKKGNLLWVLGALASALLILDILYEFQQLWLIEIGTATGWYGPAFALVIASTGIGGLLASVGARHRKLKITMSLLVAVVSSAVLIFTKSFVLIIIAQTLLSIGATLVNVLYMHTLHNALPSRVRAGASSALSTATRSLLIPIGLAFGLISERVSIFAAAAILLVIALVAAVCAAETQRTVAAKA